MMKCPRVNRTDSIDASFIFLLYWVELYYSEFINYVFFLVVIHWVWYSIWLIFYLLQILSATYCFNEVLESQFYNSLILCFEYKLFQFLSVVFYICWLIKLIHFKVPILIWPFRLFIKFLSSFTIFDIQLYMLKLGSIFVLFSIFYV